MIIKVKRKGWAHRIEKDGKVTKKPIYGIEFSQGNQYFSLGYTGSKENCLWMKGCLQGAFANFANEEIKTFIKKAKKDVLKYYQ